MTIYKQGETYICIAEVRDNSDALFDPTTIVCSITRPDKTIMVVEQSMTKDVVGKYHYDYLIPVATTSEGLWEAKVKETTSGRVVIETINFVVE